MRFFTWLSVSVAILFIIVLFWFLNHTSLVTHSSNPAVTRSGDI